MNRRGFLGGILALGAAPAIVRASSLMPVRPVEILTPYPETWVLRRERFTASMMWPGLEKWWGDQYDRLTLDYLIAQDKPPLQFNRIVRAT